MFDKTQLAENLNKLRGKSPLIHNITNYVVMNNTANALLAIGASPVMAHAVEEVEDMISISSALVLNMGTLSEKWIEAMVIAGKKAKSMGIPVIFDPVGAGATPYRNETADLIIKECRPAIIRGNASEIMALANTDSKTKGVDSTESSSNALDTAQILSRNKSSIVVVSGHSDYITDGCKVCSVNNGSTLMPKVTGMGCTATAMVGAFAANADNMFDAAVMGMTVMGVAGEIAAKKSTGPGTMQMNFIDTLYNLDAKTLTQCARITDEA